MTNQTLPSRPRLRPGLAVLHRGPGEIQIGLDPRRATVVSGLPGPVAHVAAALSGGRTMAELLDRVGPRHRDALHALLVGLAEQGLVEDAAAPATSIPRRLAADTTAAALRGTTSAPEARARAAIAIHGDGRLAVAVACLLAAAGVGRLHVTARGEVTPEDVGVGLAADDVGRRRQDAAHDAIRRIDDTVGTQAFTRHRPDLVLLTDALVPDPTLTARLTSDAVAHLCVRVRDGVGIVGPLVVPGTTSCLRCADLHRADLDACWPRVAAQLAGRAQLADVAAVQATAGLAAAQTLATLAWLQAPGRGKPAVWNAGAELDPVSATVAHRPWPPHPACPCGATARHHDPPTRPDE
ncbi:hypothetical protein [Actinokineospora sp.]|uniref:hypothetical protein n=1 Tax=Actinokineospora sp. TaxID=1872133 RepID=UPI004037B7CB